MKQLLLLTIFLKIAFGSYSQINDTICIKLSDAKRILSDAKQKPLLEEKILLFQKDITILNSRISEKESIIKSLNKTDSVNTQIIKTYTEEITILKESRDIMQNEINYWQKLYIKERRKKKWTIIGGVAVAGAIFFLTK